ncbi:MAG: SGNH/GDSL hydrolase family protein [Lachnospiraceae bacterium]|nr:SGNH/GDSL hydrolase family protein [Lachnospiraceae bacterium]
MKLSNEQLKSIYFGALHFSETEEGYLQAYQYTESQMDYFKGAFAFWYDRCFATTAKTLEFSTTATQVSFEYKFIWKGSEDSVELFVDGIATKICYVKDMGEKGSVSFALPEGEKNVVIYLPADATLLVRDFEINGEYVPAKKGEKVLWIGDSITQGYGPLRSAHTYVSVANRILNYDIINQGIGGYIYDKNVMVPMGDYKPDKIIIAMGTNQFFSESMEAVEEYYISLKEVYKDTPVLCVSPIWRGDCPDKYDIFVRFCENIKKIASQYSNVTVVDGFTLVPHLPEYYLDNLHPNVIGAELYGRNLVETIRNLGF